MNICICKLYSLCIEEFLNYLKTDIFDTVIGAMCSDTIISL